jgi:competence protein ComEC
MTRSVKPRVAIMNNGTKKGGSPSAWRIVRDSPGLEDLWQLHTSAEGGREFNSAEQFVANVDETTAYPIKVSAKQDGSFTVTNARNSMTKTYQARGGGRR